jgi:hypothetical protein
MVPSREERFEYYAVIKNALRHAGLPYNTHTLGAIDPFGFYDADDEALYDVSSDPTQLFGVVLVMPVPIDTTEGIAEALAKRLKEVVELHNAFLFAPKYRLILCGVGWTDEIMAELKSQVSEHIGQNANLIIQTVEDVQENGIRF